MPTARPMSTPTVMTTARPTLDIRAGVASIRFDKFFLGYFLRSMTLFADKEEGLGDVGEFGGIVGWSNVRIITSDRL